MKEELKMDFLFPLEVYRKDLIWENALARGEQGILIEVSLLIHCNTILQASCGRWTMVSEQSKYCFWCSS